MTPIRGIYERTPGSGIWWIRWTDTQGKLHREKAGRRSDAKTLLDKRRTETLQLKKLPEQFRPKLTFDTLCDDALEHSKATNSSKVTYDLKLRINRIRPVFGTRDAGSITKHEIVRWLTAEAEQRKWKDASRNRWQAAFSLIYRVGIDNEKIDKNPAAGIRRKAETERVRFLTDDEEKRLRAVIMKRFPGLINPLDLSLHTGMRASEQYGLRWTQIDFDSRNLHLPKTKNGTSRNIYLNATAFAALKEIKEYRHPDEQLVFPSVRNKGDSLRSGRGWFNSALKEAGIKNYSWHCNRHTFASRLIMAGVDVVAVAKLLGHKSLSMTFRYSHLAPGHNENALDRLVKSSESELAPELTLAL